LLAYIRLSTVTLGNIATLKKPGDANSVEKRLPRPSSVAAALPWVMKPSPAPSRTGVHDPLVSPRK
jgi:hypothetical protein